MPDVSRTSVGSGTGLRDRSPGHPTERAEVAWLAAVGRHQPQAGLTGTHEFTRHYFEACNNDTVPCDGNRINTPVEDFTATAIVTFTP